MSRLAELQAQLEAVKRQLTDSQRLATIGTIAAVIAHEFNNILTPIVSYAEYGLASASSDKPDIELIKKALTKAAVGSEKAGRICLSMLALARGESSPARVEVSRLVDETLIVMARDPQKDGIALRVHVEPGLAVDADGVQLEQVLLNLLINARQAMLGRGGSLTVKASSVNDADAAHPDFAGRPMLKIQVIDTGPGIPEKVLPRIFEPFFTTKGTAARGETKGTGLGLAICKEIVEHHRGRIDVDSTVGQGTTFTVWLPRAV